MKEKVVIDDLLASYIKINPDAPIKVLFLHGWQANSDLWQEVISGLKDNRLAIYALDLPGFGGSEAPKSPFGVSDYANFVKSFADKVGIEKIILVGHSFGGRIAIKLSAETNLVSKLILVNSAGLILKDKSATRLLAKLARPFFLPKFMQGARRSVYRRIGSTDYLDSGKLRETYLKVIDEDLSSSLAKISAPTLLIWGDRDQEAPLEMGKLMNEQIKGSKMVIFKGVGHFSFLERKDDFVNELQEFIK